ncbi:uncharacterized protein [Physcomitrium patens]|uniref:uncharacterized protein isoform X2 n=1 Tax=Physcomitrium patens TaxID=3218 RepID=UPI003CCDE2C5
MIVAVTHLRAGPPVAPTLAPSGGHAPPPSKSSPPTPARGRGQERPRPIWVFGRQPAVQTIWFGRARPRSGAHSVARVLPQRGAEPPLTDWPGLHSRTHQFSRRRIASTGRDRARASLARALAPTVLMVLLVVVVMLMVINGGQLLLS